MNKHLNEVSDTVSVESGHAHHGEPEMSFLRKYIFSTDHKMIGKQFLFTAIVFLFLGGLFALMLRWQLGYPGTPMPGAGLFPEAFFTDKGVIKPDFYNQLFTMHATFMIFFAIIPLGVGLFGNYLIPLQIGARDMAFPWLNGMSMWVTWIGGIIMLASVFLPGGPASAGWTSYPTLSAVAIDAQTLWVISLIFVGVGSIMGAVNYVTTIINMRAPGMGFFKMPMTTWSLFITSILTLVGLPVLTAALAMLVSDRTFGTGFFLPQVMYFGGKVVEQVGTGQPLLWQHLFWFYSHPAVYIMILPLMGVVSDVISTFARKPIFGYRAMVFAICAISFLGAIVWGHHMFQSGMNPYLGTAFSLSTSFIAIPSAIKIFNWMGTLWGGQIRYTSAMLFAISFVSMFMIGGLSGIFMASTAVDIFIHDTYFIVAHIHYVLFASSLMGAFAGIYFWFPKIFGVKLNESLGKWHFWGTMLFMNGVFFPMHILGIGGMMRRIYDPNVYTHLQHFQPMNEFMTICAIILGFWQLIFVVNIFISMRKKEDVGNNPWESNSLEWQTSSPPPFHNFDQIPTVYHGPYEYSHPEREKDYLPQDEK